MPIQKTARIWHNGKFIAWDDAKLHVMSHVVNYGSSVFEGVRCYGLPSGPAIFRAAEHMQRLLDSSKIYRIDVAFTREELVQGMVDLVAGNGVWPCYIRPIVLRGYGEAGVNPFNSPTEVYICNYPWGKYLAKGDEGVDVCVSSWTRIAPNTLPAMAKSGANYMNSQLIKMEAIVNGYVESPRSTPAATSARAQARTCLWSARARFTPRPWPTRCYPASPAILCFDWRVT